jgi:hypothetical protein
MTTTIDPPVEPTLLEELSKDPQFLEAKPTGKAFVVIGMEKQATAREWALRELAVNPRWKLAPDSDEVIGIGGGKPLKPSSR